ncbi:hypothetical protein SAMN05518872_10224 [Psychrobacillus sp. OK032]|nr:hypothetical protein SAMN05518872_10224 [Psychrobacillus sp. OK032]
MMNIIDAIIELNGTYVFSITLFSINADGRSSV